MNKAIFIFINCGGQVIAQNLDSVDAGPTLQAVLKEKAIVLPVTCSADTSQEAIDIYHELIVGNFDMIKLFSNKESVHVN
ncbi:hypothetical protein [Enterovibrio nigricans]|uniref:Uncharacterized protein n=1 Tax=Enterovibrio nigricans DSM 22720 TaxID=1121868 RepID=A0A1T4W4Z0_9GAMM|nr:hypothetical protein [Enterovibrio nigricans]PKF48881.1 hypothetical protein AT251_22920 [Enterovibrio nigricans]SKA72330.1 hypothetical protein SAMN02745132_04750 [Enterovibrio nigricans DSM 22720]